MRGSNVTERTGGITWALVWACALILAAATEASAVVRCKPQAIYGYAKAGQAAPAALEDAKASWASYVTKAFGPGWASWEIATERDTTCTQSETGATCRVRARPCRRL
jgi:hypothetical protein